MQISSVTLLFHNILCGAVKRTIATMSCLWFWCCRVREDTERERKDEQQRGKKKRSWRKWKIQWKKERKNNVNKEEKVEKEKSQTNQQPVKVEEEADVLDLPAGLVSSSLLASVSAETLNNTAPPVQENLTEEEDEAINQDETHMEQLLRAETLMMTMADEVAAEAINEITSICLEGSEEETVGKHLDYSVSTNDDAAKAIRELLEILHDDALLASVQPLENETVMAMENDEAQAEAAIDEHINLDDAEPYDDRSFGNGIMRDWMISATKSLKAVLGIPLKDIEEEPEDEPLGNEIMRDWKISATKSLKDILGIPPKDTEQDPEKEPEDEPLGNEIMRDWMISATKSLKDILGIPPKDIERDPEKEPEYEPLEKDVISVTEAEAQPEVATDTVPVYMDDTWEPKTHTRTQKGNISPTHTHTHTHTH